VSRLSQSVRQASILLFSSLRSLFQSSNDNHSTELLMMTGVRPTCRLLGDDIKILVGQHDATFGRLWRAGKGVGRRAVQPDAAAIASLPLVPFVGVIERKGAAAVKVSQLLPRQVGGDVINANRCLLVALRYFLSTQLALRNVIIGNKTRSTAIGSGHFRTNKGGSAWCRRRWQSAGRAASAAGSAARTGLPVSHGNL
jgi:hypothetical protein